MSFAALAGIGYLFAAAVYLGGMAIGGLIGWEVWHTGMDWPWGWVGVLIGAWLGWLAAHVTLWDARQDQYARDGMIGRR